VPRTAGDLQVLPEWRVCVQVVNMEAPGDKGPREQGDEPCHGAGYGL